MKVGVWDERLVGEKVCVVGYGEGVICVDVIGP